MWKLFLIDFFFYEKTSGYNFSIPCGIVQFVEHFVHRHHCQSPNCQQIKSSNWIRSCKQSQDIQSTTRHRQCAVIIPASCTAHICNRLNIALHHPCRHHSAVPEQIMFNMMCLDVNLLVIVFSFIQDWIKVLKNKFLLRFVRIRCYIKLFY